MAIKDFIYKGTYTKIVYLNFSRQNRILSLQLQVYTAPDMKVPLMGFAQQLNGFSSDQAPVVVNKRINTNEKIIEQIPEFKSLDVGESVLIEIVDPLTPYIKSMNNKVIQRVAADQLALTTPQHIVLKGTHMQRDSDGKYSATLGQQYEADFDTIFGSDKNIEVAAYQYLMSLPIFKGCEEC
jgi:hypothetical protein